MMMGTVRTDNNQAKIVQALRKADCTVQHLHKLGKGTSDLLVGYAGQNYLLEIKDGKKPLSKRKLTPDEELWHRQWRGQVAIVSSAGEALGVLGIGAGSSQADVGKSVSNGGNLSQS